ncbi:hypothetical protein B0T24DRAFT_304618 [Lasiosphaeria ovina]|uniref:Cytochrome b561 domain-containing protein n=1 Tax=Lasiosphaeria ovina TaxID=92902 RepID=A0AAE0N526_9PEZI|nr:hypothetical protein B0T24DRAFT_304618 [Lasiosphaeria ovina]
MASVLLTTLLTLLVTAPFVVAGRAQYCRFDHENSDVLDFCMAVTSRRNDTTATHDLYLAIQVARSSAHGWNAFGTGPTMAGAIMFIVYGDPTSGRDPVLSIRTADGHHQPHAIDAAAAGGTELHVLQTTWEPISTAAHGPQLLRRHDDHDDGKDEPHTPPTHIANVSAVCYGCDRWPGSPINAAATSQPWLWARNTRQEFSGANDSAYAANARLEMHKHHASSGGWGRFYVNMFEAAATAEPEPAVAASPLSLVPPIVPSVGSFSTTDDAPGTGFLAGLWERPAASAHGFLMGTAFMVLFPLGAVLMRTASGNPFKRHWVVQLVATGLAWTGAAVGLVMTRFRLPTTLHQWLGIAIVSALAVQAVLGWRHHVVFLRLRRRTWISHAHIWLGRSGIVAGWVNILLGMMLSGYGGLRVGFVAAVVAVEAAGVGVWLWTAQRRAAAYGGVGQAEAHALMPRGGPADDYFTLEMSDDENDDDEDDGVNGGDKEERERLRRKSGADDVYISQRTVDNSAVKS